MAPGSSSSANVQSGVGVIGDDEYLEPAEVVVATIPLAGHVQAITASPNSGHVYVAQPGSIAVIGSGHHIVGRIAVPGDTKELATHADGARLYVIGHLGSVSVIDTANRTVRTISGSWNSHVAVSPDGACLYAVLDGAAGGDSLISVITPEGEAVDTIAVAGEVTALAISPDGAHLHAVSYDGRTYYQHPPGCLTIIDTASRMPIGIVAIDAPGEAIAVGPDGSQLYITHHDTQSVTVVDLATHDIADIWVENAPLEVTVTPDGSHAYVTGRDSVTVIDAAADEATIIATGELPRGLRVSPDGKHCYIANFGDATVSVVDAITNSVTAIVAVGGHPEAMAVSAGGERVYVGDYWSGTVTVISVPTVQDAA
jgi:YVTN family beta-propeller protein